MTAGHRGRKWVAVGAVAALASVLGACGGSGKQAVSTQTGTGTLSAAYAATQSARTARVDLDMTVSSGSGTVSATGSGAFAWSPTAGQLTMTIHAAGQSEEIAERVIGTTAYVQLPQAASAALGGKRWLGLELGSAASALESPTGFNPAQELSLLEAHASSVTKLGSADIGGVATTHYQAVMQLSGYHTADPALRAMIRQLGSSGVEQIPMQVWIDSSGRPRQFSVSETVSKPPAGSSSAAASTFPITVNIVMGLSDYGAPVSVSAPPASQTMSMTLDQLLQLEQQGASTS